MKDFKYCVVLDDGDTPDETHVFLSKEEAYDWIKEMEVEEPVGEAIIYEMKPVERAKVEIVVESLNKKKKK